MKRIFWSALLALPLFTQSAHAQICCSHNCSWGGIPPICFDLNTPCFSMHLFGGGGRTQLGPWYQYWPYEAHFQAPVPGGMSGGPYVMTLPPQFGQTPYVAPVFTQSAVPTAQYAQRPWTTPMPVPATQPQPQTQPAIYQPVGYNYPAQVPSYWYGR